VTADAADLLFHEAELLDEGRFNDWLALLAPDLRYWAPSRADQPRNAEQMGEGDRLPLFDETRESLALRIRRLETGLAWSEVPATRTRRLVGNIRATTDDAGRLHLKSNLLVFRSRSPGNESLLSCGRQDVWSRSATWLLHQRKIIVDHRTVENISLFL
jgi:3-phenylpropionate/cinnamic acid dioxygenase small subunit